MNVHCNRFFLSKFIHNVCFYGFGNWVSWFNLWVILRVLQFVYFLYFYRVLVTTSCSLLEQFFSFLIKLSSSFVQKITFSVYIIKEELQLLSLLNKKYLVPFIIGLRAMMTTSLKWNHLWSLRTLHSSFPWITRVLLNQD